MLQFSITVEIDVWWYLSPIWLHTDSGDTGPWWIFGVGEQRPQPPFFLFFLYPCLSNNLDLAMKRSRRKQVIFLQRTASRVWRSRAKSVLVSRRRNISYLRRFKAKHLLSRAARNCADLPFPGTAMSAGPKDGGLDIFSAHFTLPLTCPLQPLAYNLR